MDTGGGSGTITINDTINNAATLTLITSGDLSIVTDIGGVTPLLGVTLSAAGDLVINNPVVTSNGNITATADNRIIFAAEGDITSNGGDVSFAADADGDGAGILTMAGGTPH